MDDPDYLGPAIRAQVGRYRATSGSRLALDLEAACRRGAVATLSFVNRLESTAHLAEAMIALASERDLESAELLSRRAARARMLQALLMVAVLRPSAGEVAGERSRASI